MIPFNKPYLHGRELVYIAQAVASGKLSGDGIFTKKCHSFFEERFGFEKTLLTTSCTDALEMAAILLDVRAGDEVIVPAYTFVSTANAFALRGAKLVFADSCADHPNIDPTKLEALITPRTRAIAVVHYAGVACDMDAIMAIAERHDVAVIEDAAQAVDSYYKGRPLGSIGRFGAFSFHETKNIISGEGGMLIVNDPADAARAEIIREKGTNRSAFFRGEVDKYGWVDIGSSFLPSELISAYLYAQLEQLATIQARRQEIWERYFDNLAPLVAEGFLEVGLIPDWATNNAHMFYVVLPSLDVRSALIDYLKRNDVMAVFHYLSLHTSPYYKANHDGRSLPNSDRFTNCLLRLPLYYELTDQEVDRVTSLISRFFAEN